MTTDASGRQVRGKKNSENVAGVMEEEEDAHQIARGRLRLALRRLLSPAEINLRSDPEEVHGEERTRRLISELARGDADHQLYAISFACAHCRRQVALELGDGPGVLARHACAEDSGARSRLQVRENDEADVSRIRIVQIRSAVYLICELLELRTVADGDLGDVSCAEALGAAASLLGMVRGERGARLCEHFGGTRRIVEDVDAALFAPYRALWLVMYRFKKYIDNVEAVEASPDRTFHEWRAGFPRKPPSATDALVASSNGAGRRPRRAQRRTISQLSRTPCGKYATQKRVVSLMHRDGDPRGSAPLIDGRSHSPFSPGNPSLSSSPLLAKSGTAGGSRDISRTSSATSISSSGGIRRVAPSLLHHFYARLQPRKIAKALGELEAQRRLRLGRCSTSTSKSIDALASTSADDRGENRDSGDEVTAPLKMKPKHIRAALAHLLLMRKVDETNSSGPSDDRVDEVESSMGILCRLLLDSYREDEDEAERIAVAFLGSIIGYQEDAGKISRVFDALYTISAYAAAAAAAASAGKDRETPLQHEQQERQRCSDIVCWLTDVVVALMELLIANGVRDASVWHSGLGCLLHLTLGESKRCLVCRIPIAVVFHVFETAVDNGWGQAVTSAVATLIARCSTQAPMPPSAADGMLSNRFGLHIHEYMDILLLARPTEKVVGTLLRSIARASLDSLPLNDKSVSSSRLAGRTASADTLLDVEQELMAAYRASTSSASLEDEEIVFLRSFTQRADAWLQRRRALDTSENDDADADDEVLSCLKVVSLCARKRLDSITRRIDWIVHEATGAEEGQDSAEPFWTALRMDTGSDRRMTELVMVGILRRWLREEEADEEKGEDGAGNGRGKLAGFLSASIATGGIDRIKLLARAVVRVYGGTATNTEARTTRGTCSSLCRLMSWMLEARVHTHGEHASDVLDALLLIGEMTVACLNGDDAQTDAGDARSVDKKANDTNTKPTDPAVPDNTSISRSSLAVEVGSSCGSRIAGTRGIDGRSMYATLLKFFRQLSSCNSARAQRESNAHYCGEDIKPFEANLIQQRVAHVRGGVLVFLITAHICSGDGGAVPKDAPVPERESENLEALSPLLFELVEDPDPYIAYLASVAILNRIIHGRTGKDPTCLHHSYKNILIDLLSMAQASADSTILTNPVLHMRAIKSIGFALESL